MGKPAPIFTRETFVFFRDLARNNRKVWMDANREHYQEFVVKPFRRLLEELSPAILEIDSRFDTAGRCTGIPSLAATQVLDVGRVRVKSYPAREIQGNVWVFFGDAPGEAPEPPVVASAGERGPEAI